MTVVSGAYEIQDSAGTLHRHESRVELGMFVDFSRQVESAGLVRMLPPVSSTLSGLVPTWWLQSTFSFRRGCGAANEPQGKLHFFRNEGT